MFHRENKIKPPKYQMLTQHKEVVRGIAVSSDGQHFISGGKDNIVALWRRIEKKNATDKWSYWEASELLSTNQTSGIFSVDFFQHDYNIALVGSQGELGVWKRAYHRPDFRYQTLPVSSMARCLKVLNNGSVAACGHDDGAVRLWDLATLTLRVELLGHGGSVNSVAAAPCNDYLVSAGADTDLRIFDTITSQCLSIFRGHQSVVNSIAVSSNGYHIASAGSDRLVKLWDKRSKDPCIETLPIHVQAVACLTFSLDGGQIVSANKEEFCFWDVRTCKILKIFEGHENGICSFVFLPANQPYNFISSGYDNIIKIWDCMAVQAVTVSQPKQEPIPASLKPSIVMTASAAAASSLAADNTETSREMHPPKPVAGLLAKCWAPKQSNTLTHSSRVALSSAGTPAAAAATINAVESVKVEQQIEYRGYFD